MKRSKILIPTLSALAVSPAIVLSSCGTKDSTAEEIINAIINPSKLTKTTAVDLNSSFQNLSTDDGKKEIIYDLFGFCNKASDGILTFDSPLTKMWEDDIVSFKTNITKCNWECKNKQIYTTFLGYISFVFNKEVKGTFESTQITFKANDYVMITYDFLNASVQVNNDGSLKYTPKIGASSIMGIYKIKYGSGAEELMASLPNPDTSKFNIKNSHNWVQK